MNRDPFPRPAKLPSSARAGRAGHAGGRGGSLFPLALVVGFSALGCGGSEPLGKSQANPLDAEENSLLFEVNRFREDSGLATVVTCASLNQAASDHSDDMRDKNYLSDVGEDGSTARSRACAAGYMEVCGGGGTMVELVAAGSPDGKATAPLWTMDETTKALLLNTSLVVAGTGRSLGGDEAIWTLDLSSKNEASCQ